MEKNEKDDLFPTAQADVKQNDATSQLLLDKEDEKRYNEDSSAATTARSMPSTDDTEAQSLREHANLSDVHPGKGLEVRSSSTKLGQATQEEGDIKTDVVSTGYSYNSMTKENYQGPNVAVYLHVTCSNRPKLIGSNGGVVVYEADERIIEYEAVDLSERSKLKPVVRCFTQNMEAKVPKELVQIGREE